MRASTLSLYLAAILLLAVLFPAFNIVGSQASQSAVIPVVEATEKIFSQRTADMMSGVFIQNRGQVQNGDVLFYSASGSVAFTNDSIIIYSSAQPGGSLESSTNSQVNVMKFAFAGANEVRPVGLDPAPWQSNFLQGNDSRKWHVGIPSFGRVFYENLWDGIDLVYSMENQSLKYDFIVRPYADASRINVKVEGQASLSIRADCALSIGTGLGPGSDIIDSGLEVFYEDDGARIGASFIILGDDAYSFAIANRDPARTMIIDPLVYSTFLGGSGSDSGLDVALDSQGNAYVTGYTDSADFSTLPGTFGAGRRGYQDIFVSKIGASGDSLLYSSFIGGAEYDAGQSIAVDGDGCAYVTGVTYSPDFPTTAGAFDTTYNGTGDAFVAKLSEDGSSLVYSTFLGGSHDEMGNGIAVDAEGQAHVTGYTWSAGFPVTPGAFSNRSNGDSDVFVTKLNRYGDMLVYSTFLGGGGSDYGMDIALQGGCAYVAGMTKSATFPTTAGQLNATGLGGDDLFVAKLNEHGSALAYSALFGGRGAESIRGLAVDGDGHAYVTGETGSADFPTTSGAYDRSHNGGADIFVARLNQSGASFDYSTFIGTGLNESGQDIAVDIEGRAHITGFTDSASFPTTMGAFDRTYNGAREAFVVRLSQSGRSLEHSTFLGGVNDDSGRGITLDGNGCAFVTGETSSMDFPSTPSAFGKSHGGMTDIFIAKFDITAPVANAGPDMVVNESTTVEFNGSASFDNVAIVNYSWAFYDGIQNMTLSGPMATHFFKIPGIYAVTLTVHDGVGNAATDTLNLTVLVYPIPTAEAGLDQFVNQGEMATFNGTASRDNVAVISYLWTFSDGINNITSTGVSPGWIFTEPGIYQVVLTVHDADANWDTDTMFVAVFDKTGPVAILTPSLSVEKGELARFDGSGSEDNVGVVNYTWILSQNGTAIFLYGPAPSCRLWSPGVFTVTLTVEDAAGNRGTNVMAVTVHQPESRSAPGPITGLGIILLIAATTLISAIVLKARQEKEPEQQEKVAETEPGPKGGDESD
jgi:PKD repeat protein